MDIVRFFEILKDEYSEKIIFLAQEILREINTIGSKANNLYIQKHVVENEGVDR